MLVEKCDHEIGRGYDGLDFHGSSRICFLKLPSGFGRRKTLTSGIVRDFDGVRRLQFRRNPLVTEGIIVNGMNLCVLTVNGGSSSIKFALFEARAAMRRILEGRIEGIGQPQGQFVVKSEKRSENETRSIAVPDHEAAVNALMDWAETRIAGGRLMAVGHRVVHGGPKYWEPQRITPEMVAELHQLSPFDPEHLPEEILLTEAFHRRFPRVPQIACFDTAFHHDLPRVAQLLPVPRRYFEKGVRRYGFHGLSCEFLMDELRRVAGDEAANGRVILAHLGNGASITAVRTAKAWIRA